MKPETTPKLLAADVIQFVQTGHMADQTIPKWFNGTTEEFVQLYAEQYFERGRRWKDHVET
jgi:hypothetical protein